MEIKNKRILISGGTLGIGKAIARTLLENGGRVVIFSRDDFHLTEALVELAPVGEIFVKKADVSSPIEVAEVFEFVDQKLGGLDILINNAGLPATGVHETEMPYANYILSVNLGGYLNCAKLASERFRGESHIINIGSLSAETKDAIDEVYVASKAGIKGFNDSLRKTLSEKTKVTLIEPGAVATRLHGLPQSKLDELQDKEEMLSPEEIADLVLYILTRPKRVDITEVRIKPRKQNI